MSSQRKGCQYKYLCLTGTLKETRKKPQSLRTIFHILQRFQATFQDDPPLSVMADGLSNDKDMKYQNLEWWLVSRNHADFLFRVYT